MTCRFVGFDEEKKEIVELPSDIDDWMGVGRQFPGLLIYDPYSIEEPFEYSFGRPAPHKKDPTSIRWNGIKEKEDIPKEFLAYLLLLGYSSCN